MFLRIQPIEEKKLIGKSIVTTLADNKTAQVWQQFMPFVKEIENRASHTLMAMQVYNSKIPFAEFTPHTPFTMWAAAEVTSFEEVPDGLEQYVLGAGLYAVFLHVGEPWKFPATWNYIMNEWLPTSGYAIDSREHFAVMGGMYKHNQPDSQEEIFIPVRLV